MPSLPPDTLKNLLFGSSFSDRVNSSDPVVCEYLDRFVDDLIEILRIEHGNESRAFRQAERELQDVRQMPVSCTHAVACKRGILLYALWKEPAFRERFKTSDHQLVSDLYNEVEFGS